MSEEHTEKEERELQKLKLELQPPTPVRTHAHYFCVRHTPAGLGQIVLAIKFGKTLWLRGEVVLFDTAISKTTHQKVFKAVYIPPRSTKQQSVLLRFTASFK